MRRRHALTLFAAAILPLALATGCPHKGPAQRAGQKVDRAKEKVEDTVDPKGPVEKAGRKIDKAVDPNK